jgi:hypothetical protein
MIGMFDFEITQPCIIYILNKVNCTFYVVLYWWLQEKKPGILCVRLTLSPEATNLQ